MNKVLYSPTQAWTHFTVGIFIVAASMMAGGIYFLEATFSAKGFYAMSAIMLVHASVTLTKTLRDHEEAGKLINRLEDAKTEKLLMDSDKNGGDDIL